jgi:hypothetical protein
VEQSSIEHDLGKSRLHLGEPEFEKLRAEGRKMTLKEAIDLALQE